MSNITVPKMVAQVGLSRMVNIPDDNLGCLQIAIQINYTQVNHPSSWKWLLHKSSYFPTPRHFLDDSGQSQLPQQLSPLIGDSMALGGYPAQRGSVTGGRARSCCSAGMLVTHKDGAADRAYPEPARGTRP